MKAMDDTIGFGPLDVPVLEERPWSVFAACQKVKDVSFFPDNRAEERAAAAICGMCPVREDCLAHAISTNERFGMWGGVSERERKRMRIAS